MIATHALETLSRDPAMAVWIERIGVLAAPAPSHQSLFHALARTIAYQQLSGKAAASIFARLMDAAGARRSLGAAAVRRMGAGGLAQCGLSGAKQTAILELARAEGRGALPSMAQVREMPIDELRARLLPLRGIGPWSIDMLLIFRLGRPDVLPLADLGIRKGAMRLDDLGELPDADCLRTRGAVWAPHRSLASLYLWRIADWKDD